MSPLPYPVTGQVTSLDLLLDSRVFPQLPGIDFILDKTPMFATGIKGSSSGREIRSAFYPYPLYRFRVQANVLRNNAASNELQKLWGFFNSQQGRFGAWFYHDEEDDTATDETFGTGDGTGKIFQLYRTVGKGTPFTSKEPVYAVWGTPTIKINGTPTSSYAIDTWGRINFTSAPADGAVLTWSGKFLYVCRFDDDELSFQQIVSRLWSQDGLEFRSIRP